MVEDECSLDVPYSLDGGESLVSELPKVGGVPRDDVNQVVEAARHLEQAANLRKFFDRLPKVVRRGRRLAVELHEDHRTQAHSERRTLHVGMHAAEYAGLGHPPHPRMHSGRREPDCGAQLLVGPPTVLLKKLQQLPIFGVEGVGLGGGLHGCSGQGAGSDESKTEKYSVGMGLLRNYHGSYAVCAEWLATLEDGMATLELGRLSRIARVSPPERVVATHVVEQGVALARALHCAGAPSWRVEAAVEALGRRRGFPLRCFAAPTGIQVFGEGVARLERVAGADIDLGAQARIARALDEDGDAPLLSGVLEGLDQRALVGPTETVVLWAALAVATVVALGGQAGTALGATMLGTLVGLVVVGAGRVRALGALVPMLAGAVVAAVGPLLATVTPMDTGLAALAAIVVLLPGWSLTVGVAEVATGHLASGGARLTGALVALLLLALGQAGGGAVAAALGLAPVVGPEPVLGPPVLGPLAVVVVGVVLGVMFRAPMRQLFWPVLGVALAWVVRMGPLGPVGEAFAAALALGVVGNLVSRGVGLPAQLVVVPGIMLRVPGGAALASVGMLMRHEAGGLDAFVDAVSVSGALVGGLLTAGLLVSPREPS